MSQFVEEGDDSGGSAAFFKRLRKGVTESASKPPRSVDSNKSHIIDVTFDPSTGRYARDNQTNSNISSNISNGVSTPVSKSVNSNNCTSTSTLNDTPVRSNAVKPYKIQKYEQILQQSTDSIDLTALRNHSWNGVPHEYRTVVWQLLLGYLPTHKGRREQAIIRKRKEYQDAIHNYYDISQVDREGEIMRQILVDLPRTSPDTPFFQQPPIQKSMERILYIWSTRHPASGYVQGMNDLLTPILIVSLFPYVSCSSAAGVHANVNVVVGYEPSSATIQDVLRCDVGTLDPVAVMNMECDAYWCLTRLLDNIQDHYTDAQPGLQRMQMKLEDLMKRIDAELHAHFESEGLLYIQFSFRWMNCLLLRELPLRAMLRVWDTYLSEERSGFENFHVYVCAVLLKTFRDTLIELPFQDMIMLLQDLPTKEWKEDDIEPILSQAFILHSLFEDSPSHLN